MKKEIKAEDLMASGVHYGYSRTRRHPTVSPFIYGNQNGSDLIDIEKTMTQLSEASNFLQKLGGAGKTVLFVGVKPEAQAAVVETASTLHQPYVIERWIGGTLTNFNEIKVRIERLEKMKEEKVNGEYSKYTKKEQLMLTREMARLNKFFGGLLGLKKLPDALVVVDSKKEHIAIAEAQKTNIPVIALGNTDCSIRGIDYPIVANDGSKSSITEILGILETAFKG